MIELAEIGVVALLFLGAVTFVCAVGMVLSWLGWDETL
jgi:hypothetical protein